MSKSRICIAAALIVALFVTLILSRQTHAEAEKKIQVEVCVLNDEAKYIEGIRIHISPYGKANPPMQTTTREKCLRFEIEATTSFDIAFWHDGRIIGVQRNLAGFENAIVRVNYKRMSTENRDNAMLNLFEIRAFTKGLSNDFTFAPPPTALNLLNSEKFKKQVENLTFDFKETKAEMIHKDILDNVEKIGREKDSPSKKE